jgi:uncharacterized protein (DUF1015 family)
MFDISPYSMLRYTSFRCTLKIMAEVIPFKGLLYNPKKVDVSATTAPPYDIVTPAVKEKLYENSPYNVIRVDFGKDEDDDNEEKNRYTRASRHLANWQEEGILINDDRALFYCYEIEYKVNNFTEKTRGFLGAVRIEEPGSGKIHPHEETYSKPKSDRLNILRYCNANISPIFSLFSSPEKTASSILNNIVKEPPFIQSTDGDGFIHRLWRIHSIDDIKAIKEEMADKDIFIADGHHRYETALAFKQEMEQNDMNSTGSEPYDYVLMFLANTEDAGLSLLPTHRIVEIDSNIHPKSALAKYFDIQKITSEGESGLASINRMFEIMGENSHSFGMYLTNVDAYYTLIYNGSDLDVDLPPCLRKLDVSVLHKFIFQKLLNVEHFEYEMDPGIAVERAKKGLFEAVFFLNPTDINEVRDVAMAGHRMPPKSTYFYPKLLTGMVIYKF